MHSALQGDQSRTCSCCQAGWSERVGAGVELGACLSLQDADKKGLGTISENVKVLAEKARANKLSPAEFQVWGVETAKLWQVDNELSNARCWCPEMQIAFPQIMPSKSTLL
jgi:pyruvate/2-oxoglutarate dehydrogenase complex dihydrolipoamide acyltransferase (E2) component